VLGISGNAIAVDDSWELELKARTEGRAEDGSSSSRRGCVGGRDGSLEAGRLGR
jgi:hypothetical protein